MIDDPMLPFFAIYSSIFYSCVLFIFSTPSILLLYELLVHDGVPVCFLLHLTRILKGPGRLVRTDRPLCLI
jgi:hypothetical protein